VCEAGWLGWLGVLDSLSRVRPLQTHADPPPSPDVLLALLLLADTFARAACLERPLAGSCRTATRCVWDVCEGSVLANVKVSSLLHVHARALTPAARSPVCSTHPLQCNLMVYAAGKYRTADFMKLGIPYHVSRPRADTARFGCSSGF
jgi:hypothetical protein